MFLRYAAFYCKIGEVRKRLEIIFIVEKMWNLEELEL